MNIVEYIQTKRLSQDETNKRKTELSEVTKMCYDSFHMRDYAHFGGYDDNTWLKTFGQNRDSDVLDRSNFQSIFKVLVVEFGDENVQIINENHWLCGWVEHIVVKAIESFLDVSYVADVYDRGIEIKEQLDDYPVYDENHYSELEYNEESEGLTECLKWKLINYEYSSEELETLVIYNLRDNYWDVVSGYYDNSGWGYEHDNDMFVAAIDSIPDIIWNEDSETVIWNPETRDEYGRPINDKSQYKRRLI